MLTFECVHCGKEINAEISEVYGVIRVSSCMCQFDFDDVKLKCEECNREVRIVKYGDTNLVAKVPLCNCLLEEVNNLVDALDETGVSIVQILNRMKVSKDKQRLIRKD
jgi:hypothetical protein